MMETMYGCINGTVFLARELVNDAPTVAAGCRASAVDDCGLP